MCTQIDKKWHNLNLSFGTRFEHFKVGSEKTFIIDGDSINTYSRSKPVFRAGANYQIAKATYLRSSWGEGFRFPSMAEMFISTTYSGIEIYANPELKPETGWSTEIGIKQGLKIGNWMGYLDAAAFIMEYDDMMEFNFGYWADTVVIKEDPNNSENIISEGIGFKSMNVGKTRVSGMEFSFTGHGNITPNIGVNILAGYTYMNTESLDPNKIYYTNNYILTDGSSYFPLSQELTYNNSSADTTVLKYRYKHKIHNHVITESRTAWRRKTRNIKRNNVAGNITRGDKIRAFPYISVIHAT